jgi:D-alanyl-D-alanine carboxypeptidase
VTALEARGRRRLDDLVRRGHVPGIQYVVVDAREVRFQYEGGRADLASGGRVSAATAFMAASSTKAVTAAAVLQLVAAGRVGLDAPLSAYYAAHPYGNEVTVRRLLNQTSGIANPMPINWLHLAEEHARFDEEAALSDVLRRYGKLRSAPGERYAYSNISYWLLGKVIERASGLSYASYVRRQVLEPIGAPPEELDYDIPSGERLAAGYVRVYSALGIIGRFALDRRFIERTESRRFRIRPVYMNGPPYGGLFGTARGLARFAQDQLRPRSALFPDATRRLFVSEQRTGGGRAIPTTLGWHAGRLAGVRYYGKPGGGPGYRSNVRIYPDRGLGSAWMANEIAAGERPITAFTDAMDEPWLAPT